MKLMTAPVKEPFCLFLVGVQCRSWTSMWKLPFIARKMFQMQEELRKDPESGLLWGTTFTSKRPFTTLYLSYWKSSEHIHRFVSDKKFSHLAAARDYNQRYSKDPNIGVWHETYEAEPSKVENLYLGMAPFGVSAFLPTEELTAETRSFKKRLRGEGSK